MSSAAPAAELDCPQLFGCFEGCADEACIQACLGRADQASQAAATAVVQCTSNRCQDGGEECMATQCGAEVEGCRGTGAVARSALPAASPAEPAPTSSAHLEAYQLVNEFETNEVHARQAYVGQRVRVYGKVNDIQVGKDGRIALTFRSSITTYGVARCYFAADQEARVAGLRGNQAATVEGTVRGWEGYDGAKTAVALDDCSVP